MPPDLARLVLASCKLYQELYDVKEREVHYEERADQRPRLENGAKMFLLVCLIYTDCKGWPGDLLIDDGGSFRRDVPRDEVFRNDGLDEQFLDKVESPADERPMVDRDH